MENYSSYPESGDSSPRSREIDLETRQSWEDPSQQQQPPPQSKVKFMCSYGGKIQPRPHDNQLSYIGGETKILSVDRGATFAALLAKLAALCDDENVSFKYQLPGEDLDALISVTNDDDLEHMMHEYERLFRSSNKPARLRIFVFSVQNRSLGSSTRSFGSEDARSEKERFVDALNSSPAVALQPSAEAVAPPPPPLDLLFGLERENAIAPPPPPQQRIENVDERLMGLDPIQKHIQDLQRLRLEEQQQQQQQQRDDYRRKSSDDNNLNLTGPPSQIPTGGVPYHIVSGGGMYSTAAAFPNEHQQQQQVYMVPSPAGGYHAPVARQVNAPPQHVPQQAYYTVQGIPPEFYLEHQQQQQQQLYSLTQMQNTAASAPATAPASQGWGMMRQTGAGVVGEVPGYHHQQVFYDGVVGGRQVIYGGPPQYLSAPVTSGGAGALAQEGKGVVASAAAATKVTTTSQPPL